MAHGKPRTLQGLRRWWSCRISPIVGVRASVFQWHEFGKSCKYETGPARSPEKGGQKRACAAFTPHTYFTLFPSRNTRVAGDSVVPHMSFLAPATCSTSCHAKQWGEPQRGPGAYAPHYKEPVALREKEHLMGWPHPLGIAGLRCPHPLGILCVGKLHKWAFPSPPSPRLIGPQELITLLLLYS